MKPPSSNRLVWVYAKYSISLYYNRGCAFWTGSIWSWNGMRTQGEISPSTGCWDNAVQACVPRCGDTASDVEHKSVSVSPISVAPLRNDRLTGPRCRTNGALWMRSLKVVVSRALTAKTGPILLKLKSVPHRPPHRSVSLSLEWVYS